MRKQFVIPMKMILKPEITPVSNNKIDLVSFSQGVLGYKDETLGNIHSVLKVEMGVTSKGTTTYKIDFIDELKNGELDTIDFVSSSGTRHFGVFFERTFTTEAKFDFDKTKINITQNVYIKTNNSWEETTSRSGINVFSPNIYTKNPKTLSPEELKLHYEYVYVELKNQSEIYVCAFFHYLMSKDATMQYYGYDVEFVFNALKEEKLPNQVGTGKEEYSIPTSVFLNTETTYNGQAQARYIADQIITKYKDGKETCQLEIVTGKYYNRDNELVFSQETGLMSVGDRFEIYDPRSKWGNGYYPKVFEITTREFTYKGVPRIVLYGKEI